MAYFLNPILSRKLSCNIKVKTMQYILTFLIAHKSLYTHTLVFVDEMSFKSAATMCSNTLEKLCAHTQRENS